MSRTMSTVVVDLKTLRLFAVLGFSEVLLYFCIQKCLRVYGVIHFLPLVQALLFFALGVQFSHVVGKGKKYVPESSIQVASHAIEESNRIATVQSHVQPTIELTSDEVSRKNLIQKIVSERILSTGPDDSTINCVPLEYCFPYPIEKVFDALLNKIKLPNDPLNPSVTSITLLEALNDKNNDYLCEGVDSTVQIRCRVQNVESSIAKYVPSMLRWALPASAIVLREELRYYPSLKIVISRLRNESLQSIGAIQEVAFYTPHPQDPENCTVFRAYLDIAQAPNSSTSRKILGLLKSKSTLIFPKLSSVPHLLTNEPQKEGICSLKIHTAHLQGLNARLGELYGQPKSSIQG